MFWKKCVPWLGSILNPGIAVSTIIFASEMSLHTTGIPSHGSDEPHLPGPMSRYGEPSALSFSFNWDTSSAISRVNALSNESAGTWIMYFIPSKVPEPNALLDLTYTFSIVSDICSIETLASSANSLIGLTCSNLSTSSCPLDTGVTSTANSISTSHISSFLHISSTSRISRARGKRPYLRIASNDITRGPSAATPGTILLFSMLNVDATNSG